MEIEPQTTWIEDKSCDRWGKCPAQKEFMWLVMETLVAQLQPNVSYQISGGVRLVNQSSLIGVTRCASM